MLGKRIINTATGAGAACTTDTVQILDGVPFQSIATYELDGDATNLVDTGYIDKAGVFNGSSSKIDLPNGTGGTGAITVSTWVNTNNISTTQGLWSFGSVPNTASYAVECLIENGYLFFRTLNSAGTAGFQIQTSTGHISNNTWHNIICVFPNTTASNACKIYIDGTERATGTSTLGSITRNTLNNGLGGRFYSGSLSLPLNGSIDQVRIFNKALSSSEVTTLYGETSASSTKSTTDIFADSSGLALYELEGNANDTGGTYNGTATNVVYNEYDGAASNVTYSTGKFGQAGDFNGSSSYIDTTYTVSAVSTQSISVWFKTTSTGGYRTIFSDAPSNGAAVNTRMQIYTTPTSTYDVIIGNNSGYWIGTGNSISSYIDGNWHNLIATYNGTDVKIYIDGSLFQSFTSTIPFGTAGNQSLVLGKAGLNNVNYWNGSLDQVRIYDKALSAADVTTLYNETAATASTNITLEVPSLVAYYKMNDATDETGSYDGTPTNVNFNVAGKFGNAGYFNGTSSKINTGYIQTGQVYSASFWGKGFSAGASVLRDTPAAGGANTFMDISTGANGQVIIGGNVALVPSYTPSTDWTHYAVVLDGTNATIYENGSQIATKTYTAKTGNNGTPVHMMSNGAYFAGFSAGYLDQVRIFDRAITSDEVTTLYNEVYCQPTIVPTNHFEPVLYTGNGTTQSISTLDFAPDFVWMKDRDTTNYEHVIFDSVRGTGTSHILSSDLTSQEGWSTNGSLTSFDSNGFTLPNTVLNNANGHNYVAWNWKAGGATVSNTDGTITSQVSANVDAGFSIVKYSSGSSATGTVGHGLSQPPQIVIQKGLGVDNWFIANNLVNGGTNYEYLLFTTGAQSTSWTFWDGANAPNSSTFKNGWDGNREMINYCFHSVDGMSKFGSYVGTGAASNSIVTGFRPAYVMIKKTSGTSRWRIVDNKRDIENPRSKNLFAEDSIAETGRPTHTTQDFNFHSNGFEIPANMDGELNQSGASFIFMAFAEEVFDPNGVTRNATDPFGDSSEVALYKFEDNANDAEGSYNGTASNVTYSTGYIDKAAVFNGSSSKIQLSQTYGAEGETFSYSFWFNTSTNAGSTEDEYIISKRNGENTFNIRIHTDGKIAVNNWTGAGTLNTHEVRSTSSYTDGNWHHFAFTYDGNAATKTICYIDGSRDTSMDWTYNLVTQSISNGNVLGQVDFGGRAYTGKIDQVRIFDRALDAGEVTQLYNE